MTRITNSREYLGDGVYAAFDGYQVWLTTENGIETTNSIALEPAVYAALERYVKALRGPAVETEPA